MDATQITQSIADFLEHITGNDYLTLFLLSFVPIVELRGAILLSGGMEIHPIVAMLICVAGASLVIFPLLLAIKPLLKKLKTWRLTKRFAETTESMLDDKAARVNEHTNLQPKSVSLENKKCVALFFFVGIPLPLTGAWTGSALGAILELPIWKAALCVFAGNVLAAAILTVLVVFCGAYIDIILMSFLALVVFAFLVGLWTKLIARKKKAKAAEAASKALAETVKSTEETPK